MGLLMEPQGNAAEFTAARGDRSSGWLPQSRSEVLARHGMVATSQPLAAQAGLQILKNGGNAIDAAVATAAVMNVVEPGSAGMGGDVFVIAWLAKNKLVALNGSGRAPAGATPQHLAARGSTKEMPQRGIDSVTAPGAVDAWDVLLKRAGTLTFKELLQPAADLAEQGFAVSERIHNDWIYGAEVLAADPDSVKTYLVHGKPPATYSLFRNPDLAHAFRVLQAQGRNAFYQGEIASAILTKSRALGGTFTAADLANTRGRLGSADQHELSRLRRVRVPSQYSRVRGLGDAEHTRGLRARTGCQPRGPRPQVVALLARTRGGQETSLRRLVRL